MVGKIRGRIQPIREALIESLAGTILGLKQINTQGKCLLLYKPIPNCLFDCKPNTTLQAIKQIFPTVNKQTNKKTLINAALKSVFLKQHQAFLTLRFSLWKYDWCKSILSASILIVSIQLMWKSMLGSGKSHFFPASRIPRGVPSVVFLFNLIGSYWSTVHYPFLIC